jgi:polar amino acid transport system substrate-binding protein
MMKFGSLNQEVASRSPAASLSLSLVAFATNGLAQDAAHPSDQKLTVAMDVGYAPWAMQAADGNAEGFQVDLINEVARRLGRPGVEIIDTNFSAIFAGLFAKRYEMIGSPIAITPERAEQMLYTESYNTGGNAFTTLAGKPQITSAEDLKGLAVATNSGSVADTWTSANAESYGFTVQRYDKDTDALQAVLSGRADAAMSDVYRSRYAASLNDKIAVSPLVITSNNEVGLVVRMEDTDFREQVEIALECMKLDGTLSKINEKWFGVPADPETSMSKVFVGLGPVGIKGFDPQAYHVLQCQ